MIEIAGSSVIIHGRDGQAGMEQALISSGKNFEIVDIVRSRIVIVINELIED
jgi:hypothetical protein